MAERLLTITLYSHYGPSYSLSEAGPECPVVVFLYPAVLSICSRPILCTGSLHPLAHSLCLPRGTRSDRHRARRQFTLTAPLHLSAHECLLSGTVRDSRPGPCHRHFSDSDHASMAHRGYEHLSPQGSVISGSQTQIHRLFTTETKANTRSASRTFCESLQPMVLSPWVTGTTVHPVLDLKPR